MSNMSNKLVEIMAKNASEDLSKLKAMAEQTDDSSAHSFETLLSTRDLKDAINDAIVKHEIDLVVMGTQGATKAIEALFGSNTVKVIKKIKGCPVMAIPEDFDFKIPKEIAFPTDFKHFYDEDLTPLIRLAKLFSSKIRILHIDGENSLSDGQSYNLAMLKAYLEDIAHKFHWLPEHKNKEDAIKYFIKELNIDILVMINYKHSFIENLLREPLIKNIGFQPTIPFLVIPAVN